MHPLADPLVGHSSNKGNVGKVGKVSNIGAWCYRPQQQVKYVGAVGHSSDEGNVGKVGKVSNVGAVSDKLPYLM